MRVVGIAAKVRAVFVALLLVGTIGCGDDDAPGTATAGGGRADKGSGETGRPAELDVCSLLETSEVEAAFGDRGAVLDGYPDFTHCVWEVGDLTDDSSGSVQLTDMGPAIGTTTDEHFEGFRDIAIQPVEIEGLGDEAFYEYDPDLEESIVTFRTGDLVLSLLAYFPAGVDGTQDQMVTLASRVVDRV